MELIQDSKVEAILGPESSSQAYFIVQLGDKAEVPIISFAPKISTLSYLKSSYFFRVAQNRSSQVYAISDILKAFGLREIIAIYEDNEFAKWIVANLIDALQDIKGRVRRNIIDTTTSSNHIKEELKRSRMMQTRVFVVHVEQSLGT
ncbi:hypothetical protein Csa_022964 [Cucumis sativus]|nr:hypothetical protein Csa_022964 [Cucumis sativus]